MYTITKRMEVSGAHFLHLDMKASAAISMDTTGLLP